MRRRAGAIAFMFAAVAAACGGAPATDLDEAVAIPRCHGARVVVVDADAEAFRPHVTWALGRWKQAVPELAYRIDAVEESDEPACVTHVRAHAFANPLTYGQTIYGAIRIATTARLDDASRDELALHELGHFLFGLGHSTDIHAVMWPIVQPGVDLSPDDVAQAKALY